MLFAYVRYDEFYRWECVYTVEDFNRFTWSNKFNEKTGYFNLPITFDIETSNIRNNEKSLKENKDVYEGFMYHWQICIEEKVFVGRTWNELQELINKIKDKFELDKKHKLVCYIHNLSFEFQFLTSFFDISNVFATAKHKVLKCLLDDCIELRCSYYLSNMNLAKFIENTPNAHYQKAKGDLDFRVVRTPKTKLNYLELGYCYNDVRGLYEAILFLLKEDNLKTIPLTNTGYVRRDCRNAMRKNKANRKKFEICKLDLELYELLKSAFRGGDTASSRFMTGVILNNVSSYDYASSYPFVMISEEYPTSKFLKGSIDSEEELLEYNKKYCTVGIYHFENIRQKENDVIPYIPFSKCTGLSKDKINYNGRIIKADYLSIPLTNVDFDIINDSYDYDNVYIEKFYFARKAYLPQELRDMIMKYFYEKSLLKGVKGKEYEYMKSKNRLNSIFGMLVTDILHDNYDFIDGEWVKTENRTQEHLDEYYKSLNSFLTYQWGVWVTAYARRNLYNARKIIGLDHVYNDTDSVKFVGNYDKEFKLFNNQILERCKKNNIINYVEIDGKKIYMGILDKEDTYDKFITLGAKKYAYEIKGKIGVTVAGLNKKKGANELTKKGGLEYFRLNETFHDSGRTVAYYNNDIVHELTVKGDTFRTGSNIAIIDTTYTLGMTNEMRSILML